MPRRAWDAPLVGRAAELATIDEAMRAAADGTAAVVLIAGEAGIGKSRLTAETANRARADNWQVLSGGCLDLAEGSVPYLPLMDVTDVRLRAGLDATAPPVEDGLTPREREILSYVASGVSNRDIAEALFISPKTVSVHVSALLRKFRVSGRGDLRTPAALNLHTSDHDQSR